MYRRTYNKVKDFLYSGSDYQATKRDVVLVIILVVLLALSGLTL
jgi:hypothetical protein